MKIEYTITLRDFKAALKLHRRQKLSRRLLPWIWPMLLLVGIVGFVVSSSDHNLEMAVQSAAIASGALVATLGWPVMRWVTTRVCYNRMFSPKRTSRVTILDIDEEKIIEINPGAEEIRVAWSGVLDVVRDSRSILIYIGVSRFFIIPAAILTPDQRAEFNDLVARHVVKRRP
jgi:hypothetical protein